MNSDSKRPLLEPETEFIGEFHEFTVELLSPDDPRVEPRERTGRPTDRRRASNVEPECHNA